MSDANLTTEKGPELWKPWQAKFIKELARSGNVTKAAQKAKITRQHVYDVRDGQPEFAAAWKEAVEVAVELMEYEARRRAVTGVLEPVFYQGMKAGQVRKYSDTLLIFLMKAHKPEMYSDRHRHEHTGSGGGPIVITEVIVEMPDGPPDLPD